MKLTSTLRAKKTLHTFHLLIVATHSDCVEGDLAAQIDDINKELYSLLLPEFENELILFETPDKISFVMDLKTPGDCDKHALSLICTVVGRPGSGNCFETPASFFVFEQDLLQFSKSEERDILSLDECRQVGAQLKMSGEMVEAALVLFHRQNTFLYFRDVLPNHVFINPQVPIDIVNGIVRVCYQKLQGVPAKVVSLTRRGIITEELLSFHEQISPHFKEGFYEVKDAIKLLCHTFTLAPMHHNTAQQNKAGIDHMKKEYLMMCLKPAIPGEELHRYIPKLSDMVVPLVVKFSSGCVPLGCFGSTISCLISKYEWEVIMKDGAPQCLAHNIAALHDKDLALNVFLIDFIKHLEIHIVSDLRDHRSAPAMICSQVRRKVFGAIEKVFEIMRLDMKFTPAFVCTCTRANHFAEIIGELVRCSEFTTCKAGTNQLVWMGECSQLEPDLPELVRLKIPEKVGVKYKEFGTLILNDSQGNIVGNFEQSCQYQTERIVMEILRYWLTSTSTPVTWKNLAKVLKDINLNRLADEITAHTKSHLT